MANWPVEVCSAMTSPLKVILHDTVDADWSAWATRENTEKLNIPDESTANSVFHGAATSVACCVELPDESAVR